MGHTTVGPKDSSNRAKPRKAFKDVLRKFLTVFDTLNGDKVKVDLLDYLATSEDLSSELDEVPIKYMFVADLAAYAEEKYENVKVEKENLYSLLHTRAYEGEITARVTDAKANAWINQQSEYQQMCKRMNLCKRQWTIFKYAAIALDMKSRMLQSKSANIRPGNRLSSNDSNSPQPFEKRSKNVKKED